MQDTPIYHSFGFPVVIEMVTAIGETSKFPATLIQLIKSKPVHKYHSCSCIYFSFTRSGCISLLDRLKLSTTLAEVSHVPLPEESVGESLLGSCILSCVDAGLMDSVKKFQIHVALLAVTPDVFFDWDSSYYPLVCFCWKFFLDFIYSYYMHVHSW